MSGNRIIFIVAGVIVFCIGLYKLLDGLGVIGDHRSATSMPSSPPYGQNVPLENGPVAPSGSVRVLPANDTSNEAISREWMAGTWSSSCGVAGARTLRFTPETVFTGSVQSARGTGTYRIGGGTPLSISLTMGGRTVDGNIARMSPETMAITLPGAAPQVFRWCGP